jgi:hypothetical protein
MQNEPNGSQRDRKNRQFKDETISLHMQILKTERLRYKMRRQRVSLLSHKFLKMYS